MTALARRFRALTARLRGFPTPDEREFVGGGEFEAIGQEFLGHFVTLGGLQSSDSVLDMGCGIGRMALPLVRYLGPYGAYDGFDIARDGVAWCQKHISQRQPRFRFTHVDLRNSVYNRAGRLDPATFRFPYDDASFTFVFATSLFTHLLQDATANYLRELARVLKPDGRALITFFLLNDAARAGLREGTSSQPFAHRVGPYLLTTEAQAPETAVAHDEEWLCGALERAGLKIRRPLSYGSWCGRPEFVSYQDIVIAMKD